MLCLLPSRHYDNKDTHVARLLKRQHDHDRSTLLHFPDHRLSLPLWSHQRSSASRPELPRVISLCSLFCFRSLPCRSVLGSIFFRFQSCVQAAIPEDTCGSIERGFPISAGGKCRLSPVVRYCSQPYRALWAHIEFCQRQNQNFNLRHTLLTRLLSSGKARCERRCL